MDATTITKKNNSLCSFHTMSMYKSCKRYYKLILLPYISRCVVISTIPVDVTHEAMPCIIYASLWLKIIKWFLKATKESWS